jgi:hypothetical protein
VWNKKLLIKVNAQNFERGENETMGQEEDEKDNHIERKDWSVERDLENEFIESWNHIKPSSTYIFLGKPPDLQEEILDFIIELRAKGYDKLLRAGSSVDRLVLSRSRRHGLRPEQACLVFIFHDEGMAIFDSFKGGIENLIIQYPRIELTPEIEEIIKQLLKGPID